MTGDEIREAFLKYFEEHGHTRVRSSPLLPANDPTLLFTNAGMNQFKDVFLGAEKRDYVRAASSQKCVRAGGKHNDLDEVGKTARHHTFFEMLGNFSFGNYFKEDAVKFAWEFLVDVLGIDPARLWFTVYEGDAEVPPDEDAERFWEQVGAPRERILRFGRKDNFWQMGETGPCGPCSEVHYYMGDSPDDPENSAANVNGPGDTIMEIWNLVFMQFERSEIEPGKYKLEPLPAPSVDTGAGLERLAVVLQDVKSNYDTDLIRPIVNFTAQLADRHYEPETQEGFAMRVIADHARATAFAIADGILPGNEGRNYVLRKIMRRAIYQGRHTLGLEGVFFNQVANFVVDQMKETYPELEVHREFIEKMVSLEEERFGSTLTVGLNKLDEVFAATKGAMPEYKTLARLYDTFGTPRDLIRVGLEERGFVIDEDEFNRSFDAALQELQQTVAAEKGEAKAKANPVYTEIAGRLPRSLFKGYETTTVTDAKVVAVIKGGEVESLNEGDEGELVLDHTPFYAESGGQVGDVGLLVGPTSELAVVLDTYAPAQGLIVHKVRVDKGSFKPGDVVSAEVDVEKRDATRRNHTATHLMHAALREVLGTHVKQAGSVVAPNYLRFDFSHYQPLTAAEKEEIERLVNYYILRNEPVQTDEMEIEEAMRSGAMALFGEKYGNRVRVIRIGDFSTELCGGTHLERTGDIGLLKIAGEGAVASGVRRVEAVAGPAAIESVARKEAALREAAELLKIGPLEVPRRLQKLLDEQRALEKQLAELEGKLARSRAEDLVTAARQINGIAVIAGRIDGLDADGLRAVADTLRNRLGSGVVCVGSVVDGKVNLIAAVTKDLTSRFQAGKLIQEVAKAVGGGGGGRPDLAQAGGKDPAKLDAALELAYAYVGRAAG